jgi:hypothetical protein
MNKIRIIFLVGILMLCACANPKPAAPSNVPAPYPASTATLTPTSLPPSITPAPVITIPSGFSPILYGENYDANTFFYLLGGVEADQWLSPDAAVARFAGEWDYQVYPFTKGNFQVRGFAPEFLPPYQIYTIGTDVTVNEVGMVGVAAGWPVLQRDVEELSSENELYQQSVLAWLKEEGVSAPELGLLHIFRVDIEGDGVDEVFISATHLDDSQHTTKAGDHSVILMRKIVGNDVVTIPVVADIYHSQEVEVTFPKTYSTTNFIDLNQDGVLEIVVGIEKWEGDGAAVYQVNGQEVVECLRLE